MFKEVNDISSMLKRHALKLIFRVILLVTAFIIFDYDMAMLDFASISGEVARGIFPVIVWLMLMVEMAFRLFANKQIALGARKHYSCSFSLAQSGSGSKASTNLKSEIEPLIQSGLHKSVLVDGDLHRGDLHKGDLHRGAALSGLSWLLITAAVMLVLHMTGYLSAPAVLIWMLLLAVADLIFVMFICPFQLLFMKNKCCEDCRIFNWDYFMMCAPMILFPSFYSISLVTVSLAVVVRWELAVYRFPHYFMQEYNLNLSCKSCKDKLCKYNFSRKINNKKGDRSIQEDTI